MTGFAIGKVRVDVKNDRFARQIDLEQRPVMPGYADLVSAKENCCRHSARDLLLALEFDLVTREAISAARLCHYLRFCEANAKHCLVSYLTRLQITAPMCCNRNQRKDDENESC
jgi:hypothetical protein